MASRTTKPRRTARRGSLLPATLTAVLLAGGYVAADLYDVAPGILTLTGDWPDPEPFPTAALPAHRPAGEGADTGSGGPLGDASAPSLPDPGEVAALVERFAADPAVGPDPGVLIVDAETGAELGALNPDTPTVPASTTKILTALAVLDAVGPHHTLATSAVRGAAGDPEAITLLAGGDLTLDRGEGEDGATIGRAGLATLAERAAEALAASGRTKVSDVVVDENLWEGERLGPRWTQRDVDEGWVVPMAPIAVDLARLSGTNARSTDPAGAAGRIFREELQARGIEVGGGVRTGTVADDGALLAEVHSAPVGDLVDYMLIHSDNVLAEALGRLAALHSGEPGSFAGAEAAIIARLEALGVTTAGLKLGDASGMSSVNQISPRTLVAAVAASADHPHLHDVIRGLPLAGLEGTLAKRMGGTQAAGTVAMKTGSLLTTATVAGHVHTREGRVLHVAVMTHGWEGSLAGARGAIDRLLVGLAECGCR